MSSEGEKKETSFHLDFFFFWWCVSVCMLSAVALVTLTLWSFNCHTFCTVSHIGEWATKLVRHSANRYVCVACFVTSPSPPHAHTPLYLLTSSLLSNQIPAMFHTLQNTSSNFNFCIISVLHYPKNDSFPLHLKTHVVCWRCVSIINGLQRETQKAAVREGKRKKVTCTP